MLSQATLDQVSVVTGANGAVTERYVYGPAVDQVLAVDSVGSQVLWMLSDQQGSVRTVISSAGTKLKSIEYDGFGNVVSDSAPTVAVRFHYTGREWDADTQLQNNRARWFDPATGRWLSNDPMGFAAGDVNLQRYVGNGGTNATDPSGLFLVVPGSDITFWRNHLGAKATYTLRQDGSYVIDVLPGEQNRDVATHDAIKAALLRRGLPPLTVQFALNMLYGGDREHTPDYATRRSNTNTTPYALPNVVWNTSEAEFKWDEIIDELINEGETEVAVWLMFRPGGFQVDTFQSSMQRLK